MLSKRKLKNSAKNLSAALQVVIDPLDNQLGYIGYQEILQAPTPTSLFRTVCCLALRIPQQAPCCICHPWLLPMLPSSTKISLDTLKGCGKCLGYQPLNGMEIEM